VRIGLIAMSGVRVRNPELARLGVTLPQFVSRGRVIASLPTSPGRGSNRWIGLDEAWATKLGVRRQGGRYRIRAHELLARLEAAGHPGAAMSVLVEAPVRYGDRAARRLDAA
jgi:hypothetical protein